MKFFCKDLSNPCILSGDEAYHCIKVLRSKVNDPIELLNGNGEMASGKITALRKTEVMIEIDHILKPHPENPNKLSVAICIPKNPARLEWFLEKATEIGVDSIFPLVSQRTEKGTIKTERLEQIIIAAAKQSGQLFFPKLHPVQKLTAFLNDNTSAQKMIAHCADEKKHLKNIYKKKEAAVILIGPEGDFTKEEIDVAVNNNYIPVSLGNSILRVETAGVVACSIINTINFEG